MLINVYAPNAGVRPARARLPFKLRWFRALQERLDALAAQGRRVVVVGDLNIARSRRDAHPAIDWQNIYQPEVRRVTRPCLLCVSWPWACAQAIHGRRRAGML